MDNAWLHTAVYQVDGGVVAEATLQPYQKPHKRITGDWSPGTDWVSINRAMSNVWRIAYAEGIL